MDMVIWRDWIYMADSGFGTLRCMRLFTWRQTIEQSPTSEVVEIPITFDASISRRVSLNLLEVYIDTSDARAKFAAGVGSLIVKKMLRLLSLRRNSSHAHSSACKYTGRARFRFDYGGERFAEVVRDISEFCTDAGKRDEAGVIVSV